MQQSSENVLPFHIIIFFGKGRLLLFKFLAHSFPEEHRMGDNHKSIQKTI